MPHKRRFLNVFWFRVVWEDEIYGFLEGVYKVGVVFFFFVFIVIVVVVDCVVCWVIVGVFAVVFARVVLVIAAPLFALLYYAV